MNKLFCGGFRSGTFLLDADLIQNECQGRDRSQESAENLSNKGVLAGQFTEALKPVSYTHLDVYKRQALRSLPER